MKLVKQNESSDMSSTVSSEMSAILREAAHPALPGEHIKVSITRAARRLGLGFRRARAFWYEEARLISAEEADALRVARVILRRERLARLDAEAELLRLQLGND